MYKRVLIVFLIFILLFSGCSGNNRSNPSGSGLQSGAGTTTIAASFYPVYIMLMNITKDIPEVMIVDMTQPTTGCLHDYTATADDMKNLESARFLVINGAGMESFMDKVIKQFPDLKIIDSSKGIPLIKGGGDTGENPHIWVSISDAILQVKNIGGELSAQDPANAEKYTVNTNAYVKKLEAERDKMHEALDGLKNRGIITFHEAFPYFAQEFGLNIVGVVEREPGSEPSAKEIANIIDMIKSKKAGALFAEPQYPATAADTIAQETGLRVYILDPAVTGPADPDAYINIMDENLKVLVEALK